MAWGGSAAWWRAWLRITKSTLRRFDGGVFQIAQPEFQVLDLVFPRFVRAEGHHFLRVVHGDNVFGLPRQQFAQEPFARAQIGYTNGGKTRSSNWPKACQDRPGP